MPSKKTAQKNLTKGREVLAEKVAIQKEQDTLDVLSGRLAQSVIIIEDLEEKLTEKDKTIQSLETKLGLSTDKALTFQKSISNLKSKYSAVYHDLRMHHQAAKCGLTKHEALEEQLDILKFDHKKSTSDSEKAISTLLKMNENLQSELSTCMSSMASQVDYWKSELNKNDTKAFMAAKFTEKEDYQYIYKLGRESKKQERLQRKEIIKARDDHQAARIASAPGLDNIKRSDRVGVIRQALSAAIDRYISKEWIPHNDDELSTDEEANEDDEYDSGDTDTDFDESD
ncbi:hypothetical protein HYPSUDRAFT_59013 [Hypholoma sublateritium FD-334 SS-4]|uniref:Uncharacterized protein n=1 Tax=Hypholoma sublateritium (strain FD-334 SS-4) TaxID=945553 RepID=A0A0D2P3C9_HYPSF|nr:hypothetical protein HYPSUDRAFT_59013 [Hypholoma sublateritium FD-334 SS-4]